jgi:hypothetical protein
VRPVVRLLARLGLLAAVAACDGGTSTLVTDYPDAVSYAYDPQFVGRWTGRIGGTDGETGVTGVLELGKLRERKLFGSFRSADGRTEYVLLLEHTHVMSATGGDVPSNRLTFTWQDGRGSRGLGWFLINREATALTGSFGYGDATEGLGSWTLSRVDA